MQLALTPEVLVLVGAGAVLLLLALVAVLVVRRRRRRRAQAARTTVADAVRDATDPDAPAAPAEDVAVEEAPDAPAAGRPAAGAAERVGSGRTVAAAVAQALAVREARARVAGSSPEDRADGPAQTDVPQPDAPQPAAPTGGPAPDGPARTDGPAPDASGAPGGGAWQEPAAAPRGRGDARDRLLAVLLDDPVRAVGAAVELEACRRQLDRLTDAVRHERHILGSVLARLAEAGLAPDQLARLSGLSDEELRNLLATRVSA
ncbi:hypothetical protein ACVGOW_02915 [Pseudonocardia saturnea]